MALSLRTAAQNCYHVAGRFSIKSGILSKIAPGVNYRNAAGNVSLQLLVSPPIPPVISAFTVEQIETFTQAELSWKVDNPPAPWSAKNVRVTITAVRNPDQVPVITVFTDPDLGLSGTKINDAGDYGGIVCTLKADLIAPCGEQSAKQIQTVVLYPPGAPRPPQQPAGTLQLAYQFSTIGSESSTVSVQFSGQLPGSSGPGTSFQVPVTQQVPGGSPDGPPVEITGTASGLQPGMWTVTVTPVSGGGAPQRCSNVQVPGSVRLSVVDGNPACTQF